MYLGAVVASLQPLSNSGHSYSGSRVKREAKYAGGYSAEGLYVRLLPTITTKRTCCYEKKKFEHLRM
jgi:hypothetical protein